MTASTCSSGPRLDRALICASGSFTEPARHGLMAMSPSSTAALNTAETLVKMVRT